MNEFERDPKFWKDVGLKAELEFHKKNKWRQSQAFYDDSLKLFMKFGLDANSFRGKTIIDAGCGSKFRTQVFSNASIIGIDPLAEGFSKFIPWSDLYTAKELYSVALEDHVESLDESSDAVICINVIDHGYQSSEQIVNMYRYLKHRGRLYLAVDLEREVPDTKHNSMSGETVKKYVQQAGFVIEMSKEDNETFDRQAKKRLLLVGTML